MNYLPEIPKLQKVFDPLDFEVSVDGGLAYDSFVGKFTRPPTATIVSQSIDMKYRLS